MDGCLDFFLCELLRGAFARRTLTMGEFDRQVRRHLEYFGHRLVLPSFIDNHDMNRFLWVAGSKERLMLAALCQFCLPGPPVVYYGTEIGLSQHAACGPLEESRLPMPPEKDWDHGLLRFYSDLAQLRRRLRPWLHCPVPFLVDDARDILCWQVGEALLVISRSRSNRLPLPASRLLLATSDGVSLSPSGTLELPGESGALLATPGSLLDIEGAGLRSNK
jgi:glycosidase